MSTAHRITTTEFDRMVDGGVFDDASAVRIELIEGELRDMTPPGPMHDEIIERLDDWARDHRGAGYRVRCQNPIGLPDFDTIPLPDMTWVRSRNYSRRRPHAEDILLVIEVADSSLGYDRHVKAALYAAASLQEYWIVNIPQQCIEVFRDPSQQGYKSAAVIDINGFVQPLAFPNISLSVGKLFGEWSGD